MNTQSRLNHQGTFCACDALRRAARSATQLYDLVLQPTGLKVTQFIALRSIEQAGELQQWRFARQHAVAVETLSRRLAVLRRKGLVVARTGGNHGERIYALTDQGRRVLQQAMPYWERAQERLARTLGKSEFVALLQACENATLAAHDAEQLKTANATALGGAACAQGGTTSAQTADSTLS